MCRPRTHSVVIKPYDLLIAKGVDAPKTSKVTGWFDFTLA